MKEDEESLSKCVVVTEVSAFGEALSFQGELDALPKHWCDFWYTSLHQSCQRPRQNQRVLVRNPGQKCACSLSFLLPRTWCRSCIGCAAVTCNPEIRKLSKQKVA